ncbi:MAG TPA: ATP-binding cassette domain-containing protein [Acidimicrobiales bacterium]
MSSSDPPAVALDRVSFSYAAAGARQVVLDELSARFPAGALTVVAGPSGAGKSTVLRLVAGLLAPHGGAVLHDGRAIGRSERSRRAYRRAHVAYVFQRPADNLFHALTVAKNVRLVARVRNGTVERDPLAAVGLGERRLARPGHLSGGEQQRVAVALGAIGARAVLAADEPTAQVDEASAGAVVAELLRLRDAGVAVVVASHDRDVLAVADHVVDLGMRRVDD